MNYRQLGESCGNTNKIVETNNAVLLEAEYFSGKADWHYHENSFFAIVLHGEIFEISNKIKHHCSAGTLLFQNWEEPNCHIAKSGTRSFLVELNKTWYEESLNRKNSLRGNFIINNPNVKAIFHCLYKESKLCYPGLSISI